MKHICALILALTLLISSAMADDIVIPRKFYDYITAVDYFVPFTSYTGVRSEEAPNGGDFVDIRGEGYTCVYYETDDTIYMILRLSGIEPAIPFIYALQHFAGLTSDDAVLYYYYLFASATRRDELDMFTWKAESIVEDEYTAINITVKK